MAFEFRADPKKRIRGERLAGEFVEPVQQAQAHGDAAARARATAARRPRSSTRRETDRHLRSAKNFSATADTIGSVGGVAAALHRDVVVNLQRHAEAVVARAEIGGRGRDADGDFVHREP